MNRFKKNEGSFTVFMCIILSALIFLMTILLSASKFHSNNLLFKSLMFNEHDYILSNYSEIVLDRYGLFATTLINDKKQTLPELMKSNNIEINDYKIEGVDKLEDEILYNAIISFSSPRFPMAFASDILSRYVSMSEILRNTKTNVIESKNYKNTQSQKTNNEYDFYKIISIINSINFSKFINEKQLSSQGVSLEEMNKMFLDFENNNVFEPKELKTLKTDLIINNFTVNEIASVFDHVYDFNLPSWYERLSFEQYIYKMFSCKVNYYNDDSGKTYYDDLRNRKLVDLSFFNKSEIEKIIFGFEEDFNNEFFAKMSIQSLRTMIHIISYLIDESKLSKIKIISAIYCGIIAVVTSGAISIPPEVMDVVLLIVFSTAWATVDYMNLIKGNSVKLIPLNLDVNFDTYYKDYLFLFQIMVSKSTKLERISAIIRTNTHNFSNSLYTNFNISANYNNKPYSFIGGYYD